MTDWKKRYKPKKSFQINPTEYQIVEIIQHFDDETIEDGAFVIIPPKGRIKDYITTPTDRYSASAFCSWFSDAFKLGMDAITGRDEQEKKLYKLRITVKSQSEGMLNQQKRIIKLKAALDNAEKENTAAWVLNEKLKSGGNRSV